MTGTVSLTDEVRRRNTPFLEQILTEMTATGWSNCEFRSYQFVDPTGEDDDAALRETEESWQRREGNTIAPTQTEQRELRPIVLEKMAPYLNLSVPNGKLQTVQG